MCSPNWNKYQVKHHSIRWESNPLDFWNTNGTAPTATSATDAQRMQNFIQYRYIPNSLLKY